MPRTRLRLLAGLAPAALLLGACGSGSTTPTAPETAATDDAVATDGSSTDSTTADPTAFGALFDDGALAGDVEVVDCTLSDGTATTCYQVQVPSLAETVDSDGPFCPETVDDVGGIWVWDGDQPGLYALDADFWDLVSSQGFDFSDDGGQVTVTDPVAAGGAGSGATANSCLEATPDGSFTLQVLLPTDPQDLAEPSDVSTVSQVGLALDGVTIFGDAPSVAQTGGLPALDACGGHVDPSGYYHWHFGADSIQTTLDEAGVNLTCDVTQDVEALLGFAYDGYAIYGPEEDGQVPLDLDSCSGHVGETDELGATYHYHLSDDAPNLPACLVGAGATGALTSPDNPNASLPGGSGGAPGGPPPGRG